jgi:hypothetical protein
LESLCTSLEVGVLIHGKALLKLHLLICYL